MTASNTKYVCQRLVFARDHAELTPPALRKLLEDRGHKISRQLLWKMENQRDLTPSPVVVAEIAEIAGVSLHWIWTGRGAVFSGRDHLLPYVRSANLTRLMDAGTLKSTAQIRDLATNPQNFTAARARDVEQKLSLDIGSLDEVGELTLAENAAGVSKLIATYLALPEEKRRLLLAVADLAS